MKRLKYHYGTHSAFIVFRFLQSGKGWTACQNLIVPLYAEPQTFKEQYTQLDTEIRDATDSLLDALMEHFDDCENVLDCYLGKESQKLKKKIVKWKIYRDHVGKIVNQIKHQQRRVRTILFYGPDWAVPGYFIEGPLPGKIIGPDPSIHPGGDTAFSFRRNLLFHLWGLYDAVPASIKWSLDDK